MLLPEMTVPFLGDKTFTVDVALAFVRELMGKPFLVDVLSSAIDPTAYRLLIKPEL
jgi:hypothetical protein